MGNVPPDISWHEDQSLVQDRRPKCRHPHASRRMLTVGPESTTGPPENVRDHVMVATKALSTGDWAGSFNHLAALSVWNLVPKKDEVRSWLFRS